MLLDVTNGESRTTDTNEILVIFKGEKEHVFSRRMKFVYHAMRMYHVRDIGC
jgi:hypothetical protein